MLQNYPLHQEQHFQLVKNHYNLLNFQDLILVAPSVYYGSLNCLNDEFFKSHNFKIVINCLPTYKFLARLSDPNNKLSLSTDVIVMSLDLHFDVSTYSEEEKFKLDEFMVQYNRVLQNFLAYFVTYNDNCKKVINDLPSNLKLSLHSPLLTGNLKNNLFKLIRIVKLFKIINNSIDILIVGEYNENVSKALIVSYLMDQYNINLNACLNNLNYKIPINFNSNYYNDLLILENLKKFYQENNEIKKNSCVLYNNKSGKRSRNDENEIFKRTKY